MERKTSINDFRFELAGYGMTLIDATKNADNPKQKDLENLKRLCKNG